MDEKMPFSIGRQKIKLITSKLILISLQLDERGPELDFFVYFSKTLNTDFTSNIALLTMKQAPGK